MPSRKFPTGELYENHKQRYESGVSVRILADEVGMDVGSYKNRAGFYRWRWSTQWVTDSNKPRYNKPLKLKGERLILCDAQIPFHNAGFMNSCIDLALAWGIRKALFAGDIFDMTAFAAPKFHTRPSDTFQVELSEGRKFIKVAIDLFDEVDPNSVLTVSEFNVTWDNLERDDGVCYINKSYGVSYFGEFTHYFTFNITELEAGDASNRAFISLWSLQNVHLQRRVPSIEHV